MLPGRKESDPRLEQALELLHAILAEGEDGAPAGLAPWEESRVPFPPAGGRLSATDSLSWWFRPAAGRGGWDEYFAGLPAALNSPPDDQASPPLSPWIGLRLLLAEPEEELLDIDADSVIEGLYSFLHAVGRRDVAGAMAYVAPDFHMLEEDQEVDAAGLERKIRFMLDSLRGWELEVALVEIPQPILHPDGILVYSETLIDAWREDDQARRSILERRIAFFARQPDGRWLLAGFAPVEWPNA
ncbi:MAG: hypothetical protein ACRDHL_08910 [Candidatus Promineifilaceae bacterium]